MKTLSFRDLLLCEELSHIRNEIELLSVENDDIVKSILSKIGFDVDYPFAYVPSKHRDMQGKVAVGFRVVGEVSCNREFVNSSLCSLEDRIIAAGYQDVSLARDMSTMSGGATFNYSAVDLDALEDDNFGDGSERFEEDAEFIETQIKQLEGVRDAIRGSMYNEAGSLKTFEEYKK